MRIRDMLSFIAFGLMIAFVVGYVDMLGIRVRPPSHRTNVSMSVADINGLVVGSSVLLRGAPIGKVSGIEASVGGATVDFYIEEQFHIPVDSDARLENLSALGESYIGLVPRTQDGPMLHDGQRIATESVTQPPSISDLATSIGRVLNQMEPGALERIVNEADIALPDASSVLPNISRTSRLLRDVAANMNGHGRELLDNFQTLLRNAEWLGPLLAELTPMINNLGLNIRSLISTIPAIIDFVKIGDLGPVETIQKFNDFLARIQKLLDDNGGDLKVLGDRFQPHITGIAGSLLNFDTGQILTNLLDSMPEDGVITLHVGVPGN